jgi:hydroxymethylpyrimidine pyrophosphatase-like HAD family hydrolase
VKAAFAFVRYKGQAGVITHPDLLSDFRYRLVEKRRDGAQDVRGHPDIRLLLADVDGTLVTQDKVLAELAKGSCARTARRRHCVRHHQRPATLRHEYLIEPLALQGAIAGFNGGVFVNPDLTVIESHTLDPAIAQRTLKLMLDQGLNAWVYTEDEWLIRDKEAPHVARETSTVKFDAKVVASFTDVHLAQAVKIVGISDDLDLVAACEKAVQNTLGGRARRARSHTIST